MATRQQIFDWAKSSGTDLPTSADGNINMPAARALYQEKTGESGGSGGNTGLPFGLCEKYGISLPENATPKQAWDALAEKGIAPPWTEKGKGQYERGKHNASAAKTESATETASEGATANAEEKTKRTQKTPEERKKESNERYKQWQIDRYKKDMDFFYGEGNWHKTSNQYYSIKHHLSDDEVIINTNDIKFIKGQPVLVVGQNQGVYLKEWQGRPAFAYMNGELTGFHTLKLNRKYFKPYTFKFDFKGYEGVKPQSFDDMVQIAKEQDKAGLPIKFKY